MILPPYNLATSFTLPVEITPGDRTYLHAVLILEPGIPEATAQRIRNNIRAQMLHLSAQLGNTELLIESDPAGFPKPLVL